MNKKSFYVPIGEIKKILNEDDEESVPSNPLLRKSMKVLNVIDEHYEEHIKELPVYVSVAYRYGDREGHSYPCGVFRTLEAAIADAEEHRDYRGGKYEIVVYESDFSGNQEEVFCQSRYLTEVVKIRQSRREDG